MAFQDAWNIDLERLKRCCVHVITPGKKLVPFCAYYLTSATGQRLIEIGVSMIQPGQFTGQKPPAKPEA
jgi:hypothetical protein